MTFAMSEHESRDLLCLTCGIPETSIAFQISCISAHSAQLQNSYRVRLPRYASGTVRNSKFLCFPVSIDDFCQERETLNYKKAGHCSMFVMLVVLVGLVGPDKHSCDLVSLWSTVGIL